MTIEGAKMADKKFGLETLRQVDVATHDVRAGTTTWVYGVDNGVEIVGIVSEDGAAVRQFPIEALIETLADLRDGGRARARAEAKREEQLSETRMLAVKGELEKVLPDGEAAQAADGVLRTLDMVDQALGALRG